MQWRAHGHRRSPRGTRSQDHRRASPFAAGFTAVELLVVIAVVALLAAMLLPVLARAREKARQSVCLSNLRQVSAAHRLYVEDWDERYPDWWQEGAPISRRVRNVRLWTQLLAPYVRSDGVLFDPSFTWPDRPASGVKLSDFALLTWGPYGSGTSRSPYYRWAGATLTAAQIVRPAATFSLTDGWTTTTTTKGFYVLRHGDGLNAVFLDGHVRWLPSGEFWRIDRHADGRYYYAYATVDW